MLSSGTSHHGTTNRHRDLDDFKFLSLFVYLTDVDLSNGPHVYERGTHFGISEAKNGSDLPPSAHQQTVFVGKAGSAFLEDNWGVHHGMTIEPGQRRICLWIRYGLYDNWTSRHSVFLEHQKTSDHEFDTNDEITKYVFRFLV